ncbi:MAG: transcription antitermination factor NusB [Verrucomicrobia bacterium]|nr:transcription antitermination factor NusB [Verrucomicrobiota bacterium]MDE3047303.1 transcription antitermination factor NusB [Verrucomicrobiota bacterium]
MYPQSGPFAIVPAKTTQVFPMALPPQKVREAVFQILFMSDFAPIEEEMVAFMMAEMKTTRREIVGALARVKEILEHLPDIDAAISRAATDYAFDRISRVERTILRLGLFELLFDRSIPQAIAIAEGIRLARKFGTVESAQFINAILDAHAAAKEPAPV